MPLTDAQWARIEPLLPDRTPKRGGRWRDHREVIDAIASTFQQGHRLRRGSRGWGLRSGDLLPELVGEATQEVQRLSELGPAVLPAVGGPGAPDPTCESIGEVDGVAGAEQVEG
ncbi:transposase [Streptomyces lydicus]|nr:transposase [Streptomyces lydicus]